MFSNQLDNKAEIAIRSRMESLLNRIADNPSDLKNSETQYLFEFFPNNLCYGSLTSTMQSDGHDEYYLLYSIRCVLRNRWLHIKVGAILEGFGTGIYVLIQDDRDIVSIHNVASGSMHRDNIHTYKFGKMVERYISDALNRANFLTEVREMEHDFTSPELNNAKDWRQDTLQKLDFIINDNRYKIHIKNEFETEENG